MQRERPNCSKYAYAKLHCLPRMQEFERWLGGRVVPIVVDDTSAPAVKTALQEYSAFARPGSKPKILVMSYTTFRRAGSRGAAMRSDST